MRPKPDVTFALSVSGGGDYDDLRFATVMITPPFARLLLKLMKQVVAAKKVHRSAYRLEAFDYTAEFYDDEDLGDQDLDDLIGAAAVKEIDQGSGAVIPKRPEGLESARMECNSVVVGDDDVHWSAYRKNGDFLFTTSYVTRAELEAIAKGRPLP
jgi:hypothetical protein